MFERIKKAADDVRSSGDFALQAGIYKSQVGLKFRLVWIRSETIGNLWTQAMRVSLPMIHCSEPVIVHSFAYYLSSITRSAVLTFK